MSCTCGRIRPTAAPRCSSDRPPTASRGPTSPSSSGRTPLYRGYSLTASLAPGSYTLVVFARSSVTGVFTAQTVAITIASDPQVVSRTHPRLRPSRSSVQCRGLGAGSRRQGDRWGVDLPCRSGAYRWSGAVPVFVGYCQSHDTTRRGQRLRRPVQRRGILTDRRDVCRRCTYDLVLFARSHGRHRAFNNAKVVRITVQ